MAGPFDFLFGPDQPGTDPAQPAQTPQQQADIYRQDRGLVGNLSRGIYGPSAAEVVQGQQFQRDDLLQQQQSAASANIMKRLAELKAQNPNMPKGMIQQQLFNDPVWLKNILQNDASKMLDVVNKVQEGIYGEDKYVATPADSSLVKLPNQTTDVPGTQPTEAYRTPKTLKPGELKVAKTYKGGDPELEAMGFRNLDPSKDYEVKSTPGPDGRWHATDIGVLGPGGVIVNMGDQAESKDLQSRIDIRNDIEKKQHAIMDAVNIASRIEGLMDETGAAGIGPVGFITRLGQASVEQAKAAAEKAGIPFDVNHYTEGFKAFKGLDVNAQNSAALTSNILALAFTIAKANNNGAGNISDKDVNRSLKIIGDNFGSTKQLRSALREVIGNSINSVDNSLRIYSPSFKSPSGKASITPPRPMADLLNEAGMGHYVTKPRAGAAAAAKEPTKAPGAQIPVGTIINGFRFLGGTNTPDNWEKVQ